ncbi:hypothetical protein FRY74_08155 [Vicingus serpentipes]|uniref:Polysaccharide chain length determinant N-terminal domain-containing protein n=1 Tax=Vicingus serpentipes TaxID=1926625 RepID=A0A5C6RSG9_9FLAO|nr:Wzz/FepE/Etk N-terminal domain-containing protein [Vicingus serpentipes]TXB65386.1 hypothetical protein FRY74_08155 [Vicingus serpentipes]
MSTEDRNLYQFNKQSFYSQIMLWKKQLLFVALFSIICSSIFSFFIKDKYQSSVILYPTTTSSISKALITENFGGKDDILEFGDIEQAEQLIQILNSDEIKDRIVEKYDLMNHYCVDENDDYKRTKLDRLYKDNISFKLTKYMAVEIKVLDCSSDTAALIANDISMFLDTVKNRMRREIAIEAFKIVENEYNYQNNYVVKLEDSLTTLRQLGVIDYESQAERITEQMSIAILQGKQNAVKALEDKLSVLSKYGGAYVSIRDQLEYEKKQLTFIHSKYQSAKVDAESNLQHKFIVNKAVPAEKPVYPIRWLIVLISTISVLLLSIFLILLFNKK